MKCNEIKNLLDQYIDNALGKDEQTAVKKHLSKCSECSAELSLLKEYKKAMHSLKIVKPPADFIQQLNSRIDKQSKKSDIIRTLFSPLDLKLPAGVFGLLAVSVLVVVLLNPFDQMKKNSHVPVEVAYKEKAVEREIQIANLTKSAPKAGKAELPLSARVKDAGKYPAGPASKMISASREPVKTQEIVLALYDAKPAVSRSLGRGAAGSSEGALQMEESVADEAMDMNQNKKFAAKLKTEKADYAESKPITESEKKIGTAESEILSKSRAAKKQEEPTSRKMNVLQSVEDIKRIAANLNGRIIKKVFGRENRTEYVVIELPGASQKAFIKKLGSLGIVQLKDAEAAEAGTTEKVRFKVQLIAPGK